MKLLVTGGAGFIGSHFIHRWLTRHPADQIVTLDALTYAGSRERLADVDPARHRFLRGSVGEPEVVREAVSGCEVVVHFAAETHVDRSITDAVPFIRTNVEGTYVLLREAQAAGVKRFLHVSTDEVYGPILEGAVTESASLAPRSPYAASKAAGDLLVQAARETFGLPAIIVRPTNVFGPWQFPEKFIPLCITRAAEAVPIPLYGDGRQRRAWLFVADCCEAIERLVEQGEVGASYNLAGGVERENRETATLILSQIGRPESLLEFVADRPGHDRRYAMDDAKLRALGWQPRTPFEQGISDTITWYLEHREWWKPLAQKLRDDPAHWLNRPAGPGVGPIPRPVR